ncbi:MAG: hypothetical protein ACREQH_13790 [Candidatus Binatus sp.]
MRHSSFEYGPALRACLSRAEVRETVAQAKHKGWPHLNDSAVRLGSLREFAARAYALGADLRIARMSWPTGLSVMGFYLGKDSGLEKRPLICLNGAHHPAAVATAFLHEVGHHVTADLFSMRNDSVQLSRQTGYEAHLNDPRELSADVLVSLGLYPRGIAVELFDAGPARRSAPEAANSSAVAKAARGTANRYGLDLESLPAQKKLQYQAGLIHFTRLRRTLLEEYGL